MPYRCEPEVSIQLPIVDFSPEQRALWQCVVELWDLAKRGDEDRIRNRLHVDYVGWDLNMPLPHDREAALRSVSAGAPPLRDYDLQPLSVRIYDGRIGIAHYTYTATTGAEGQPPTRVRGKWSEVYLKQDGKWTLVSVSGRPDSMVVSPPSVVIRANRAAATIRALEPGDRAEWHRLRLALWPDVAPVEHEAEMRAWLERADTAVFVAARSGGGLAGFAEAGTRPYADGCLTSPVAFLEGWYVDADARRLGVGRALVEAVEQWARSRALSELASDALLDNTASQRAHEAVGFSEVERAVRYCKSLTDLSPQPDDAT